MNIFTCLGFATVFFADSCSTQSFDDDFGFLTASVSDAIGSAQAMAATFANQATTLNVQPPGSSPQTFATTTTLPSASATTSTPTPTPTTTSTPTPTSTTTSTPTTSTTTSTPTSTSSTMSTTRSKSSTASTTSPSSSTASTPTKTSSSTTSKVSSSSSTTSKASSSSSTSSKASSSSSTSSIAQSSSAVASPGHPASTKIGVGVGVPLGIICLALIGFLTLRHLRHKNNSRLRHHGTIAAAGLYPVIDQDDNNAREAEQKNVPDAENESEAQRLEKIGIHEIQGTEIPAYSRELIGSPGVRREELPSRSGSV